jgi:hypothetical protein
MKMRSTLLEIVICLILIGGVVGMAIFTFAAVTIDVFATIPSVNNLSVSLSRALASGGNWTNASSVDFGTLNFDNTWKVFRPLYYYAADVGASSNGNWTITHTRSSIMNATLGANLDDNVNVEFKKKGIGDANETQLSGGYVSFANSNNKAYTKSQFNGGYWLRIYYGIATGNTTDASNVTAITTEKPAGSYQGTATITLSQ